jgi:hypothetical protein
MEIYRWRQFSQFALGKQQLVSKQQPVKADWRPEIGRKTAGGQKDDPKPYGPPLFSK